MTFRSSFLPTVQQSAYTGLDMQDPSNAEDTGSKTSERTVLTGTGLSCSSASRVISPLVKGLEFLLLDLIPSRLLKYLIIGEIALPGSTMDSAGESDNILTISLTTRGCGRLDIGEHRLQMVEQPDAVAEAYLADLVLDLVCMALCLSRSVSTSGKQRIWSAVKRL